MNYKRIKSFLMCGVLACLVIACSRDNDNPTAGNGSFRLSLQTDNELFPIMRSDADDDSSTPSIEDFSITLADEDGNVIKSWSSISNIPYDATYDVGNYKLSASYGSATDEGFEVPYYYGESQFTIRDQETTDVDVVCTLGQVKMTVKYTEAFTKYFTDYSTTLRTAGGKDVVFEKGETRSAYLRPGNISMKLNLTKANGISATYEPAKITNATARQHYVVTFDVTESVGAALLTVVFDNETAVEPITIDVSDEAMVAPAPYINMTGVSNGAVIEVQECEYPDNGELSASITARGGLAGCTMTTQSDYLTSLGFPAEVELTELTAEQKTLFESLGLEAVGFDNNRDKMALVNFTELTPSLLISNDATDHTFTLTARDNNGKVSEPVTFTVRNTPLTLTMGAIADVMLGSTYIDVPVTFNGKKSSNMKLMRLVDGNAQETPYTITQQEGNNYTLRAQVNVENESQTLQLRYAQRHTPTATVGVTVPQYTIQYNEYDVWSSRAVVRVSAADAAQQALIEKYITFYVKNGSEWDVLSPESTSRGYNITNLAPATQYTINTACLADKSDMSSRPNVVFTTEATQSLPNGQFEEWTQWFSKSINMGGRYGKIAGWTQQTTTLTSSNPNGWCTVNSKTVPTNPSTTNTWYMTPSTLSTTGVSGNGVLLRNVAWDNNGSTPPQGTWGVSQSLNSLSVPSIANRSAGKLFLGSYSYDHNTGVELYNEGIPFTSRPNKLTGYYKYVAKGNDTHGQVTIVVEHRAASGQVITLATRTLSLNPAANYAYFEATLSYTNVQYKATHLRLMFTSSSKASNSQAEESQNIKTVDNKSQAVSTGSELYIDNISLTY